MIIELWSGDESTFHTVATHWFSTAEEIQDPQLSGKDYSFGGKVKYFDDYLQKGKTVNVEHSLL